MQRHYPPKHLFSHCRQIYCHSQDDDERLSEKQIDIISSSLDEITETVASLVVSIKIYPVVLNHGIAHDYGEQQKKQCHYKNSLFLFRESLYHIFHGANIVFFSKKVLLSYKKVSIFYVLGVYFLQVAPLNNLFPSVMRFPGIYRKMVNPAFYPPGYIFSHFLPPFGRSTAFL